MVSHLVLWHFTIVGPGNGCSTNLSVYPLFLFHAVLLCSQRVGRCLSRDITGMYSCLRCFLQFVIQEDRETRSSVQLLTSLPH
jgi:hypothetical protein